MDEKCVKRIERFENLLLGFIVAGVSLVSIAILATVCFAVAGMHTYNVPTWVSVLQGFAAVYTLVFFVIIAPMIAWLAPREWH